MPRFSCPSCFKVHAIPDHLAGLPGKCGRCGYGFTAPGTPRPAPQQVFVPAAAPDPFATGGLYPRPTRGAGWGGALQAVTLGLILAVLLVGFLWGFRDQLVAAHPGLEAMLPPKVVQAPPRVAPPAVALSSEGWMDLDQFGPLAMKLGLMSSFLLPLIVPAALSRRHMLSVGRWLIFAGTFFLLLSFSGAVYEAEVQRVFAFPSPLKEVSSLVALFSILAMFGCLIAAAIHPKSPHP